MVTHGPKSLNEPRSLRAAVVALLVGHAFLLAWGAWRHSPTWDEVAFLPAGIRHWQYGTFGAYCGNPPLVRMVAALPVLVARPEYDWSSYREDVSGRPEYGVGARFIAANGERSFWLFTLARWACIPFSLLGGIVCYLWARDLYGPLSGLLAASLWCVSPNIIAHGQLITPDVGSTALGVAACYAFWRWLKQPNWRRALLAGVVLGLAELAKMSWILLFGIWPLLWLAWLASEPRAVSGRRPVIRSAQLGVIFLLSLYVLNLGYGFEGSLQKLGDYRFVSGALGGAENETHVLALRRGHNRFARSRLGEIPVPVPKHYLLGLDLMKYAAGEINQPAYLRGTWSEKGRWYYYPYALAVKVPLGTWLLALLALAVRFGRTADRPSWRDELALLLPMAVFFVFFCSHTSLNKHLRYVLPVFPFAFIWISGVAGGVARRRKAIAGIVGLACVWSFTSSLWIYPHSLSYFNEVAGGPNGGPLHLHGSNCDWGQDLLYLREWLKERPEVRPLGMAYFLGHFVDPGIAGIACTRAPVGPPLTDVPQRDSGRLGPRPGWYAVSTNLLFGYKRDYDYFQSFRPVATVGYSIYVYRITRSEANRVRRRLGLSALASEESRYDPYDPGNKGGSSPGGPAPVSPHNPPMADGRRNR